MAVKSVIDVEVNDEAFKEFHALFARYQAALGQTPKAWATVEKATEGTALNVENLIAGLLTYEAIAKKIAKEETAKAAAVEKQGKAFRGFVPVFREVARSVGNITASILKWSALGSIAGGLLGYGGLLGLDRLALDVGGGRRRAQGLGTSYGEERAFENTYDRIVDSRSFLGNVSTALTDVTKRWSLYGAGFSEKDLAGRSTGAVANDLLPRLKSILDGTPDAQIAQVLQARALDQFISTEDARRLKATSPGELAEFQGQFGKRTQDLDLADAVAKKWQDLGVVLDASKLKIENVLVDKLASLAGPLEKLSASVAEGVKNFLTGLDPETIKGIGKGIEDFGKYLGGKDFRDDVKNFATDVSYAAQKIAVALKWLGLIPDANVKDAPTIGERVPGLIPDANVKDAPTIGERVRGGAIGTAAGVVAGTVLGGPIGGSIGAWLGGAAGTILPNGVKLLGEHAYSVGSPNWTNPGNIRWPGSDKFVRFDSDSAGIRAISRQIQLYERRDHLDTLAKIVAKYAPAKDGNNVKAYVADLERYTGLKADQRIDPNDKNLLAKIVAGITKHEGRRRYSTEAVGKIIIKNNTGGSAVVQGSQASKQS